MATTAKGVQKTLVDAGGPSTILQGFVDARVKAMLDSYAIAGTEIVASTISLGGTIPAGAKVIGIVLYVSVAQAAATFSVGDGASATRYGSAITSLQTAGTYFIGGLNYVVGTTSGDNVLKLTTGGATLTAATLQVAVLYTFD